ncbi:MAG: ribosome maturation factor RimM [Acidimicrobiales bacterium]
MPDERQGAPGAARLLAVGEIVRPHGLAGAVVVRLGTNLPGRLAPGTCLIGRRVQGPLTSGDQVAPEIATAELELRVVSVRSFQHRYLVCFDDVQSREGAEELRGVTLLAPAVADSGSLFVHEVIGCEVVDTSGHPHGPVVSVEANPASDLLVGEQGWLIPARFVVSHEPGLLVVDVPAGLFE